MGYHPMVIAAAKEQNRRVAFCCNVDEEDQWRLEGDVFLSDAQAMLEACGAFQVLDALEQCESWVHESSPKYIKDDVKAAIFKATGSASQSDTRPPLTVKGVRFYRESELTGCAADKDGECTHSQCPQLRDCEPKATVRHCPLDATGSAS